MIFFGNKDVEVTIEKAPRFTLGQLDKLLIASHEEVIPAMAIYGETGVVQLEKWAADNSKTIPKTIQAIKVALGQKDKSGNPLIPKVIYVVGAKLTDPNTSVQELVTAIEAFDSTREADFWAVTPIFESVKFEEWAQTYAPRHFFGVAARTARDFTKPTSRMIGILDEYNSDSVGEYANVAFLARCLFMGKMTSWKNKNLTGITAKALTDAEVVANEKKGWNAYRTVRSKGETTGSICSDLTTHADEIYLRDTIIFNVANMLKDMFDNNEIVPMGLKGQRLVRNYISQALQYCTETLGLIETGEDGQGLYKITVPYPTAAMKSIREMSGIEFEYEPVIPMEKIKVTGKEVLEFGGEF